VFSLICLLEISLAEAQIDVAFRLILDPYTPVEFDSTASSPSSACTRTLDSSISSHAIPSSVVLANWKHMSMITLVWSLLDSLLSRFGHVVLHICLVFKSITVLIAGECFRVLSR
jgi:hypothetical protein